MSNIGLVVSPGTVRLCRCTDAGATAVGKGCVRVMSARRMVGVGE